MNEKNDKNPLSLNDFSNPGFTRQEIDFLIQRLIEVRKNSSLPEAEEDLLIFLVSQLKKLQATKREQQQKKQQKQKNQHSRNQNKSQTKQKQQNPHSRKQNKKKEMKLLPGGTRQRETQDKEAEIETKKDKLDFKRLLQGKLGEFVIINLMTGGDCCEIRGVLCTIESDFIILIDHSYMIQVKIKDIASIRNKINIHSDSGSQYKKKMVKYEDQFYLKEIEDKYFKEKQVSKEDNNFDSSKQKEAKNLNDSSLQINKRKKNYIKDK